MSARPHNPGRFLAARAFTLIEVSITIIIIAVLAGIVLIAVGKARRVAQLTGERQVLVALKQSITAFENDFGFLPPLVHDNAGPSRVESNDPDPPGAWPSFSAGADSRTGPVDRDPIYDNQLQPVAVGGSRDATRREREQAFLEGFSGAGAGATPIAWDFRYSAYSLPYYLMGVLDVQDMNKAIDGADGPRLTAPRPDGTFTRRGKAYDAFYDISTNIKRKGTDASSPQYGVTFNDRWNRPIRYYRWEARPASSTAAPGSPESKARTLVPRAAGDPRTNPKLRGARYALVILGEDHLTDMRRPIEVGDDGALNPPLNDTVKDDIVEVEE